jgi:hypothetical protein
MSKLAVQLKMLKIVPVNDLALSALVASQFAQVKF